ncbi:pilus assembly protein PilM [bacterium]|nr:pilus assembly protein PilM [bacterium]
MAKNIIGIDISDFSIEAIVLEKDKRSFKVEAYSRFRLSPDIVEDGKILAPDKLKEALQTLFKNAKPKSLGDFKKVFLSIPESKVYARILSLPKSLKGKELLAAARNQAEEIIPESFDKLIISLKELSAKNGSKEVFFSAAEIETINDLLMIFREMGIEIVGIVPEALSSFAGLDDKLKQKTTLMLDMGARTTVASIFDKYNIRSSINIDIAGDNITKAIADKLDIPYSAAEEKKQQVGLTSEGGGEVMLIIQGQLQPLADELKEYIAYYQDTSGQPIEQIVLVGGLAQMKGLDKYFGDNLAVETQVGYGFMDPKILPENTASATYINVLGLAKLAHQGPEINFYKNLPKTKKVADLQVSTKLAKSQDQGDGKKPARLASTKRSESRWAKRFGKLNLSKSKIIDLLITLAIIILGSLAFVFRNNLLSFYNSFSQPKTPIVADTIEQNSETVAGEENKNQYVKYFTVGLDANNQGTDYILAETLEIELSAEKIDPSMVYDDILLELVSDLTNRAPEEVRLKYQRNDYYIVPEVLGSHLISLSPTKEEFVAGDTVAASINFNFFSFEKRLIEERLNQEWPSDILGDFSKLKYEFAGALGENIYGIKVSI